MLASAATCGWVGVPLLADDGEGGGAVSHAAAIVLALGCCRSYSGRCGGRGPRSAAVATGLAGRRLTTCPTTTAAADPTAHQSPPP